MEIVSGEKMWESLRDVLVQTGCFASLDVTVLSRTDATTLFSATAGYSSNTA